MTKYLSKIRASTTEKAHNHLLQKSRWYFNWHLHPARSKHHFAFLFAYLIMIAFLMFNIVFLGRILPFGPSKISVSYANINKATFHFNPKNAKKQLIHGKIDLIDPETGKVSASGRANGPIMAEPKKYKIKITPDSGLLSSLEFDDVNLSSETNLEIAIDEPATPQGWDKSLAIGETSFAFSKGRFTTKAKGKDLFKCTDWNFDLQKCNGRWKKIADITPGQDYTIEFTPGDPGYNEKSNKVNVLDISNYLLNYEEQVVKTEGNLVSVDILPNTSSALEFKNIEKISIEKTDETSPQNDLIIETFTDSTAQKAVVIDATNLAAAETKIDQTAQGKALLSCTQFDYASLNCSKWKKENDLILNENYTVTISSAGKSAFGQSRDGMLLLNKNYEIIPNEQVIEKTGNISKTSVQLINLNPYKITAYYDDSAISNDLGIDVALAEAPVPGKTIALNLNNAQATEAEIEGTAEGYDLFQCSNFDFANQICLGNWKKNKDLVLNQNYTFQINNENSLQGFFESKRKIALLGTVGELLGYDEKIINTENNNFNIELTPAQGPIQKIRVKDYIAGEPNDLKIASSVVSENKALQSYAIDPTGLQAESTELEIEAKGNTLYKCKDWDFTSSTCLGPWSKIKSLNPGSVYSLTIDRLDPAFIEIMEGEAPFYIIQATDASGYITFVTTVSDGDLNNSKLKVEYSDDGGSAWYDPYLISATPSNGSTDLNNDNIYQIGTTDAIDTSSGSIILTIIWNTKSASNSGGSLDNLDQDDIWLRVTPNDGVTEGIPVVSSNFEVDNLSPSGLTALTAGITTATTQTLNWSAVTETNFNHYEIWYGQTLFEVENRLGSVYQTQINSQSTITKMISGLLSSTTYYFKIWAIDDFGNEETVEDINATTSTPPAYTPIKTPLQETIEQPDNQAIEQQENEIISELTHSTEPPHLELEAKTEQGANEQSNKQTIKQLNNRNNYIVQKGDTLSDIALRFLGSGFQWKELVELNKEKYPNLESDPSYILPGWILMISIQQTDAQGTPLSLQPDKANKENIEEIKGEDEEEKEESREFGAETSFRPFMALAKEEITDKIKLLSKSAIPKIVIIVLVILTSLFILMKIFAKKISARQRRSHKTLKRKPSSSPAKAGSLLGKQT